MIMNGILVIDKPSGWTSHDVIAKLRGVLKIKRIGHGGTLDPMATGVLPVFIGRATRAAEFCENAEKEYIAEILLGTVTDTQDITGNILEKNTVSVSVDDLATVLPQFTGSLKQIPPMYSAIKKDGQKLYELARRGIEVTREPRNIFISKLEILESLDSKDASEPKDASESLNSVYTLRIVCSKGTYIRTLCHDIGAALGSGATLSALRRTGAGVYKINEAHTPDDVTAAALTGSVNDYVLPVDGIFSEYPSLTINEIETKKAKNGAVCKTGSDIKNGKYKIYSPAGEFLLFGEVHNSKIKTIKSFFEV